MKNENVINFLDKLLQSLRIEAFWSEKSNFFMERNSKWEHFQFTKEVFYLFYKKLVKPRQDIFILYFLCLLQVQLFLINQFSIWLPRKPRIVTPGVNGFLDIIPSSFNEEPWNLKIRLKKYPVRAGYLDQVRHWFGTSRFVLVMWLYIHILLCQILRGRGG